MPRKRSNPSNPPTPDQCIPHIVKTNKLATVQELVELVQQKHYLPQEEIIEHILNLQSQEKLTLHEKRYPTPSTMRGYILSPQAYWYWIIMTLALAIAALVFTLQKTLIQSST
jgi:hypothetical protein